MNWTIKVLLPASSNNEDLDDISRLKLFVDATKCLFKFDPSLECTSLAEPYSEGSSILESLESCKTQAEIDYTKDSISMDYNYDFSDVVDDIINSFYDQFDFYCIWIDPTKSNKSDNYVISSILKKSVYPEDDSVRIYLKGYNEENEKLKTLHDLSNFGKHVLNHDN